MPRTVSELGMLGKAVPDKALLLVCRLMNGKTHWLWCFTTKTLYYYVITRNRGSPVIKKFLGIVFRGILVCDFWGAYNKISALAQQRCFYHLFTELVKVDAHNRSAAWKAFRKKLSRLLKDAIRLSEKKNQVSQESFLRKALSQA